MADNEQVTELYQLGGNSVKRGDMAKAKKYFEKLLKVDPDHLEARSALRAVNKNLLNGKKVNAYLKAPRDAIAIKLADMRKNYKDGFEAAEKILSIDPDNAWAHLMFARFAKQLNYKQAARFSYEVLADLNPGDLKKCYEAADFLTDLPIKECHEKAFLIMDILAKRNPNNADITSMTNTITSKKLLDDYSKAENSMDVQANQEEAKRLEQEERAIRTDKDLDDAIERAIKRDKDEPNNPRHRETAATLLFRKGKLQEARQYFEGALELDPSNNKLMDMLGDVKIETITRTMKRIEVKAKQAKGEAKKDLVEKLKQAKKKRSSVRMTEYKRRLKINPNDLKTRYELGTMLFAAKKIDESITQFQRAVHDPRLSYNSARYLGECFKHKNLTDLAIEQFNNAAKRGINQTERLNMRYEVALCNLELGKKQETLDIFKEILEKDFEFKDVAKRVQELQSESR